MLLLKTLKKIKSDIDKSRVLALQGVQIDPESHGFINFSGINFKEKGGSLIIGKKAVIKCNICLEREGAVISIGENSGINDASIVSCAERIEIGDDVMIGWGCTIIDNDGHSANPALRKHDSYEYYYKNNKQKDWERIPRKAIKIENKVWIGFNSIIMKGVTIGEGSIVTAGSVVFENVPPWSIVRGNPATIVREIPAKWRKSG